MDLETIKRAIKDFDFEAHQRAAIEGAIRTADQFDRTDDWRAVADFRATAKRLATVTAPTFDPADVLAWAESTGRAPRMILEMLANQALWPRSY